MSVQCSSTLAVKATSESKTSPETPLWKKEVAERRKRREASPVRKHPEIIEKRPEIPEWKKKLSVLRRPKSTTIAENPAEESVDQVPGFMKEFEKKKKNRTRVRPPPETQISNTATVPQWKKQLAEKRKQRVDLNDVQETNKENESKTSPETPLWKKEVAERRKRREASPVRKHPEIIGKRPEIPEWKKKLPVLRRPKSTTIAENPAEESVDQVPRFMKEFEKKKKNRTRGK
ncbi:nucleolar protein 58-like [Montipora capricornis]|uniref:nucleolar protein 58-like n=1 Tax=Montipora capricornis TaxID=246305 RepID=UPI0035F1AB30